MDETTKAAMESGRPLTIFNIREVHQLNPNATHNTNNYYGDQFVPKDTLQKESSASENATCNPQLDKTPILDYVMKLHPLWVRQVWQDKYTKLWESLMDLPEVANKIYNPGRQKDTTFNRNLTGNILHLLAEEKVLATNNATKLAEILEGDSESSVRAQLGVMPPKEIERAIVALL